MGSNLQLKKVIKVASLEFIDEVNSKNETVSIRSLDITDRWEKCVKKVKAGKSDCSSYKLGNGLKIE